MSEWDKRVSRESHCFIYWSSNAIAALLHGTGHQHDSVLGRHEIECKEGRRTFHIGIASEEGSV